MAKLVMQSSKPLHIGEVYRGIWDPYRRFLPNHPVKVIAESTAQEFIECLVSFGEEKEWAEIYASLDPYFYIIETD